MDGTVRLDQRYRKVVTAPTGFNPDTDNVDGSGYGRYGTEEEYIVAIDGVLYRVDLTEPKASWAYDSLTGGTYTPDTKEWFFQQFNDYIYGVHSTAGFGRTLIGSDVWTFLSNPTAPAAAPVASMNLVQSPTFSSVIQDLTGSTFGGSPAGTGLYIAGSGWRRTLTATHDGQMTFEVSFAASVDYSYSDYIRIFMSVPTTVNWEFASLRLMLPAGAYSSEGLTTSWFVVNGGLFADVRIANISRTTRTIINGLSVTLIPDRQVPNGSVFSFGFPWHFGVWLSLDSATNPGAGDPTFQPLVYEYTYYNSTTGLESLPSPQAVVPAANQNRYGQWENIAYTASVQVGVDKIRIYRVVTNPEDQSVTRYRLTEVANGTSTFVDKRPLEEVEALTIFYPFIIPTSGFTQIAAWQDRLVLAVGSLLYISREGDPLSFTPLGTVYDPTDPARARTFYPDDSRSEQILGLAAQDALYIATDRSVRALYGTTVDDWRLVRMPEGEGSYGNRSWYPYRNGILVHTPSYRTLWLHVGLGSPEEVSKKLRARIGSAGLGASRLVAVRPNGEIEIRRHNDSGPNTHSYRILDVNGNWRGGNHFHETHSFLYVPSLDLRWVGVDGNIYEGGKDEYTDDDGEAVLWTVRTKFFKFETRVRIKEIYLGYSEQVQDPNDTSHALYPAVTVIGEGSVPYVAKWDNSGPRKTIIATREAKDAILYLEFQGDKDTVLKQPTIRFEPLSRAAQK